MKVGDLVRNKRHPHAGVGIIIKVLVPRGGLFGDGCALAFFPEYGNQTIYGDEAEVVNESR